MAGNISSKLPIRQAFSLASYYSGVYQLSASSKEGRGARIVCFHGIHDRPGSIYAVSPLDFSRQMLYLVKNYKIVPLDCLVEACRSNDPGLAQLVAVTIDDGYLDFYQHGYPLLRELHVPATVFLPTGMIDGGSEFKCRLPQREFLTWDQIREMQRNGIDFGSHTVSHRSLTSLTPREIEQELRDSKARVEAELGREILSFCYPYGTLRDVSQEIGHRIASAGYSWAVSAVSGVNRADTDRFALRRTVINRDDHLGGFTRAMKGALDGWIILQKLGEVSHQALKRNRGQG